MSSSRRAYDILRGYVNNGWERIQGGEENSAERELREALEQPNPSTPPYQANERPQLVSTLSVESARRLLDVPAEATSKQIKEAREKIRATVDPSRFPSGSAARERATHLLKMIDGAERVLIDNLDPTIRRFENLQVE
jgi:hypothetical protein